MISTDIWPTTHMPEMIETAQYSFIREMKEISSYLRRTQASCGKLPESSKHIWVRRSSFGYLFHICFQMINDYVFSISYQSICRTSLLRSIHAIWKQIIYGSRILGISRVATSSGRLRRSIEQSTEYKTTAGDCVWWFLRGHVGRLVPYEVSTFGDWRHCIIRTNSTIHCRLQSIQYDFDVRFFVRA